MYTIFKVELDVPWQYVAGPFETEAEAEAHIATLEPLSDPYEDDEEAWLNAPYYETVEVD